MFGIKYAISLVLLLSQLPKLYIESDDVIGVQ